MNKDYFSVYLKNGTYYTFKLQNYGWKIVREEGMLYVLEHDKIIKNCYTVLVVNMDDFSHIRYFEGDLKYE